MPKATIKPENPARRSKARQPSELECFTLGLVWRAGPCSPYDVRRSLLASPSTQWSASAGAIYPMMARLERQGLLQGTDGSTGKRPRRLYTVTAEGLEALRRWIGPPLAPEAVTVAYDPLRSRARFLDALAPAEQRAWIAGAEEALDEVERRVRFWRDLYAAKGDIFAEMVSRNGELDVRWRRKWLADMAHRLPPAAKD